VTAGHRMPGRCMVPAPVWVQVVTAAEGRCECTLARCHGASSRTSSSSATSAAPVGGSQRCEREHPTWVLVAAPRDPQVSERAAWRVPAEDLAAWCAPCLDGARAAERRAAAERAARELEAALLPLPAEFGDCSGERSC
jgi:hypothetical protein